MKKFVQDILKSKGNQVCSIAPQAKVYEALELMAAKNVGAVIVESNVKHTHLTHYLTDYFLPGPAGEVWPLVLKALNG